MNNEQQAFVHIVTIPKNRGYRHPPFQHVLKHQLTHESCSGACAKSFENVLTSDEIGGSVLAIGTGHLKMQAFFSTVALVLHKAGSHRCIAAMANDMYCSLFSVASMPPMMN
jgi:hypothetical protein